MSTLAELTTYVRGQALLDTSDVSDAIITTYLNRAIEAVGGRFPWPFLQAVADITTVVGTTAYNFPTGAVKINSIIENGKRTRLKPITAQEAWTRYGDDPPTRSARAFYIWNEQINLVEIPDAIVTLHVKFHKQPTLLTISTSTPQWNSQYHQFLGDWAISKLWEREEDRAAALDALQRFELGIGEMANFYNDQVANERMVWGEQPDRWVGSTRSNLPWLDGV